MGGSPSPPVGRRPRSRRRLSRRIDRLRAGDRHPRGAGGADYLAAQHRSPHGSTQRAPACTIINTSPTASLWAQDGALTDSMPGDMPPCTREEDQ